MRIAVTSQNKLKIGVVRKVYSSLGYSVEVVGYSTDSGVGEQPVNDDTLGGAQNRISDLRSRVGGLDRIVSIENGIFREGKQWVDRAVVVIYNPYTHKEYRGYSFGVVFPEGYVEIARQRGFDTTTVGQVMAEAGFVSDQKDPHLSIFGISRVVYLEDVLTKLVTEVEFQR